MSKVYCVFMKHYDEKKKDFLSVSRLCKEYKTVINAIKAAEANRLSEKDTYCIREYSTDNKVCIMSNDAQDTGKMIIPFFQSRNIYYSLCEEGGGEIKAFFDEEEAWKKINKDIDDYKNCYLMKIVQFYDEEDDVIAEEYFWCKKIRKKRK